MTDYRKATYDLHPAETRMKKRPVGSCYSINLSSDHHMGILNGSHEMTLTIIVNRVNTTPRVFFVDAWELGCGEDWSYETEEEFKQDHPGLLRDIEEAVSDGRAKFDHIIKREDGDYVMTNIGEVPIEEFREITAHQNGFDSYKELRECGYMVGNGYDA